MKIAKFTYRDAKGKTTEREVLVTGMPSDKLMGIDTKDMHDEFVVFFAQDYDKLYSDFLLSIETLKYRYDCDKNFRTFTNANITNLELDNV